MKSSRLLFLFIISFIDVKVRAGECTHQHEPCVVHTSVQRKIFSHHGRQFVLAPDSLLEQSKEGARLIKGRLYVESEKAIRLTAPFGYFECEQNCWALLEREWSRVKLQALKGFWRIHRLGDSKSYGIPAGMEMQLGRVEVDGAAEMEFPQSIPWESAVKNWARLFPGTGDQFKESLTEFREIWREAVEAATDLQQREAGRTIASHEAELDRARARQKAQEREDEGLRRLFREKNNIYP